MFVDNLCIFLFCLKFFRLLILVFYWLLEDGGFFLVIEGGFFVGVEEWGLLLIYLVILDNKVVFVMLVL